METGPLQALTDASLWFSVEFADPASFTMALSGAMKTELLSAARSAATRQLSFDELTPVTFPLPTMRPLLDDVVSVLEEGRGFSVLRGVPVQDLGADGSVLAMAGLASHLGELVAQSVQGNKIEEITDRDQQLDHTSRGYAGTRALAFHTDGSDYAALLCLSTAAAGGESLLASAAAAHETIRSQASPLLSVLKRGFFHHRRGEQPVGEPAVFPGRQPVFRIERGLMHAFYNRNYPDWLAREGIEVTEVETAAQDLLDEVLRRPEHHLKMQLQLGDLQFINNYTVLHARTTYQDSPEQKRSLLRVWIRNPAACRSGPNIIDVYAPWESRKRYPTLS